MRRWPPTRWTEEFVLLSLPGPAEVEGLCLGAGGLLERMAPGAVLVNLSTVGVDTALRLEEAAAARGVATVDAPVTGAADGAAAGTMTIMVGATTRRSTARGRVLEPISAADLPPRPARARAPAAKLLTNMLWFIHVAALSDALALAAASGLDPARFGELVRTSAGGSWVADHDLDNILAGDDDPSFTLALCVKDLRLIGELEAADGYASDLAAGARARFGEAHDRFGPAPRRAGRDAARGGPRRGVDQGVALMRAAVLREVGAPLRIEEVEVERAARRRGRRAARRERRLPLRPAHHRRLVPLAAAGDLRSRGRRRGRGGRAPASRTSRRATT